MKHASILGALSLSLLCVALFTEVARPAQQGQEGRTPPVKLEKGQRCLECHQQDFQKHRVHAPVQDGKCTLCHTLPDPERHVFVPAEDMGSVCRSCHTLPQRTTRHQPFVEGKCLECHKPHDSDQRYLLRKSQDRDLCGQCHADQTGSHAAFVHGPVASGTCRLCHTPHASAQPHLLKEEGSTLCLQCHVEMGDRLQNATSVHPPVQEQCSLCHDAHASEQKFQLHNEPKKLCLDCHQPMLDDLAKRSVHHAALDSDDGCLTCHDVHASTLPKLLKKPIGETCLSCHDGPTTRPDGTETQAIGELLRRSKSPHGPVKEGNCAACHDPHGSNVFSLLRQSYPKTFYSPFQQEIYGLCFHCHDNSAFLTEDTDKLTGFRNGSKNLHFVHVNRDEKGRTCRACHETHASNHPVHIRDSVPFGNWELPIGFEKSKTGGSCSPGCHAQRGYDRIHPIEDSAKKTGEDAGGVETR